MSCPQTRTRSPVAARRRATCSDQRSARERPCMNATPDELTAEAGRWLRFAAEDLEAAEALRSAPGVAARHVATLAQQSAEKAVKAGLVLLDVDPPSCLLYTSPS